MKPSALGWGIGRAEWCALYRPNFCKMLFLARQKKDI